MSLDTQAFSTYSLEHAMGHPHPERFEVYMLIKDRKRLARLIEIQEVSKRAVARAAGWKSHTYLQRLLSGQATSCEPEHAVRIAAYLQVDLYDLFTPKMTSVAGRIGSQEKVSA